MSSTQTIRFATFMVEDLFLGVELESIQEIARHLPTVPVPFAPSIVRGLINLRGEILTAVDLRHGFGMARRSDVLPPTNLIVRTTMGPLSILVDEVGDVVLIETLRLERPPPTIHARGRDLIRAAYQLGPKILLVLDLDQVLHLLGEQAAAADAKVAPILPERGRPHEMVPR